MANQEGRQPGNAHTMTFVFTHTLNGTTHGAIAHQHNCSVHEPEWLRTGLKQRASGAHGSIVTIAKDGEIVRIKEGDWIIADPVKRTITAMTDDEFKECFTAVKPNEQNQ